MTEYDKMLAGLPYHSSDPKMLELSVYDGIPHLLTPVVTDPKKAVVALKWTVREMEDRYKKMSKLGVRNIDGYNARAEHLGGRAHGVPANRRIEQLAEQLALPAVPGAWTHCADVHCRQDGQIAQPFQALHFGDKILDGLGIGQIASLCG